MIAIENVRLARTNYVRTASLPKRSNIRRQPAKCLMLSEVRPTNCPTSFQRDPLKTLSRICDANFSNLAFSKTVHFGDRRFSMAANHNFTAEVLDRAIQHIHERPSHRSWPHRPGYWMARWLHMPICYTDPGISRHDIDPASWRLPRARSHIGSDVKGRQDLLALFTVGKAEARPFSERQIQLLGTICRRRR